MLDALIKMSMTARLILFCAILSTTGTFGQGAQREKFKLNGKKYNYYVLKPLDSIKGILILLPGRGEIAKNVFSKTELPNVLQAKGYLTIIPELHYSLFADDLIKRQLQEIFTIQSKSLKPSSLKLTLGGFSAGGSVALSYAEYLLSENIMPYLSSVFVIDPPLDLERVYASSMRLKEYCNKLMYKEGQRTISYLEIALGGSPNQAYVTASPFSASQLDGGNAKWLTSIPLRLYTEPDIDFVRNRYCNEIGLDDLNVTDLERLSQFLQKSGTTTSELIITKGRGYHTWNIAEPRYLAEWIIRTNN